MKRDFQKIVDRPGEGKRIGEQGLKLVKETFAAWHEFKEKKVTRLELREKMRSIIRRMNKNLIEGTFIESTKGFCENVLELEAALWTFIEKEGVEPTNNWIERMLRLAVLWRKRSYGCQSEEGCRFVERMLTAVQTLKLQNRNVLDYLQAALTAYRSGTPCPKLIVA